MVRTLLTARRPPGVKASPRRQLTTRQARQLAYSTGGVQNRCSIISEEESIQQAVQSSSILVAPVAGSSTSFTTTSTATVDEIGAGSTASASTITTVDVETAGTNHSSDVPTKSALKRLKKLEKLAEKKKIRRQNEREKRKKNRAKLANTEFSRTALKRRKMATSDCKVGIAVDLSFDEHMNEKNLSKTVSQVSRCYSFNRRLPNPVQFHVTSFNGKTAEIMKKFDGFTHWDVNFHEEPFDQVFDKSSIVYLTSDSPNVLQKLEPDKFYIIGGLVDHNSKKGICYEIAKEKNINHARLPIEEFIDMKTRKVLSIVHVFEVLANVTAGKSWPDALLSAIPARKQAEAKESSLDQNDSDSDA